MRTPKKNRILAKFTPLITLILSSWAAQQAPAGTEHWIAVPGTSVTTNWTDAANWGAPQQSFFNNVDFNLPGGGYSVGNFSVNNVFVAATGVAQMPMFGLRYYATNVNYTTLILPGQTLATAAGNNGNQFLVGADQTGGVAPANSAETVTITGAGGTLSIGGGASGVRIGQGGPAGSATHYVTLDLSGLDTFLIGNAQVNSRFLLPGGGAQRSQGAVYFAKTNVLTLGNDFEIGFMGSFSNTLPVGAYLGLTNAIITGNSGAASDSVTVGSKSCTNAFLKFNPAFLGGANPPAFVYFAAPASVNGGRVNNFWVCNNGSGIIPANGYCDLTGGYVNIMATTMQLGGGSAATSPLASGTGILTFDNGIIDVNTLNVGTQTASAGAPGIGVINMSTNCTLKVNTRLTLAALTGTATAGDAGTINMNGGTLIANVITNGAGVGTINMTNATWQVTVTPGVTTSGSATVTNFTTGGATNLIIITFASLPSSYPVTTRLVKYQTLGGIGTNNMGISLPTGGGYAGFLVNNTSAGAIDLVLTAGASPSNIAWSGADNSGNWDVATTVNWTNGTGAATVYNQLDSVRFDDTASGVTSVNLIGTLTPSGLLVTNASKTFTFGGAGSLSGAGATGGAIPGGLVKQGTGILILANTTADTYLGGVNISAGVLQVGNGITAGSGSLGPSSGAVLNSGGLVFNRPSSDTITVANVISGAGGLTNNSGTLLLAGANTFSGPVSVTSGATLKLGSTAALGTTAGATIVAGGATLDLNGRTPTAGEPIFVQGVGTDSSGAIVNSGAAAGQLTAVTLTGDTTFGGASRWDLATTLNSSGPAFNVTMAGTGYFEWRNLNASTSVQNIIVNSPTTLGWVGSTAAGSSGTMTVDGTVKIYNDAVSANLTKPMVLDDGSTVANGAGSNTVSATINLNGFDTFDVAGTALTLSGALTGTGNLYKQAVASASDTSPLYISGTSPAFGGNVLLYAGKIFINGILGTGASSTITSQSGTILAGTGTNNGPVDVSGGLTPGNAAVVGTNTFGSLTLEASAMLTNDLATTVAGASDLIVVNGDLTMNNSTVYVNPIGGTLEGNRAYTLITYSGNFNGSVPAVQTALSSVYTIILTNVTTTTPKKIQAIVTGGQSDLLVWNNASGNGEWDVQGSANWSNTFTHVGSDVFYSSDAVLLSDSITNSAVPATTLDIASAVGPSAVTNNSTTNYTISGAGKITGGASIVKLGTSTLTLSTVNDFTGPVTILGGKIFAGANSALGAATGTLTITNGGTMDLNGFTLGSKPIVVSGAGVGGNGAIINSGGAVFDNGNGLTSVTLAADATFGGTNRWDLGGAGGAVLSTGGKSNNVSIIGNAVGAPNATYWEWFNLNTDTNLANINILSGELGVKGTTTLGNPTNTVTIYPGGQMTFWGGSGYLKNYYIKTNGIMLVRRDGPTFNLNLTLEGGATFSSMDNVKTITGPVVLLGVAHFLNANAACTFSNVISGLGGISMDGSDSNPLIFAAANTYTGPTLLNTSGIKLALIGSGSISSSTNIALAAGTTLDVSGRPDKTLTLASGQILQGNGTVSGSLTVGSGAIVSPGLGIGALTVTNVVTLQGATVMELNKTAGTNDVIKGAASIQYGGTLGLTNVAGSLAAGDSFKLFSAGAYSGAFANIVPPTTGTGCRWDTSLLTTSGTLLIAALPQPDISTVSLSGGNMTLSGTNGTAGGTYYVLTSTDLTIPMSSWTSIATNIFDGAGHFAYTTGTTNANRFFAIKAL